jgi:hypothetical protein
MMTITINSAATCVYRVAVGSLMAFSVIAGHSGRSVVADHDFEICKRRFALCAASTCRRREIHQLMSPVVHSNVPGV